MLKKPNTGRFLILLLAIGNFVFSQGLKSIHKASQPDSLVINIDGTTLTKNFPAQSSFSRKLINSSPLSALPNPNCYSSFYVQTGASTNYESGIGIPNTSTLVALPANNNGLAIGPNFGFPAPNPTYWCTVGGNYAYFDGTNFINTGHSTGNVSAVNIGGSKNYIYNLVGGTGQVYKYNGTGASTLVATIPALALGGPYDLVGDDQDNFYYLRTQIPQSLNVYNLNGVLTCSYAVTGIGTAPSGGGFAIVGNTVTAHTGAAYYVGILSGGVVNFTATPNSFPTPADFANCYLMNVFNSSIAASPNATLTCSTNSLTLTASSTSSPVTYTWSGPGIVGPVNGATITVNQPGVYTASLTSLGICPTQTSTISYTVYGSTGLLTPTISSTGSLTCSNPTTQLSVAPNSVTNTISWSGPGIVGTNNTPTIIANAAGIYSVTLTNTLCSGTATYNLLSGIAPLTLSASASATQLCFPGGVATLSITGGSTYTWTPAGSLVPSTGSVVVSSPSVTTIYTVNASNGACTGSTSITISVNPTPTLLITSGSPTICAGITTTLTATGATTYTWNPGNLTGSSVTVAPASTTGYTVTGANGSCSATAVTTVVVIPGPTLTASANPTVVCPGVSSTLSATGAISYTWMPGSANTSSIVVNPVTTTIYTVGGTNAASCTGSITITLSVAPIPTISISPSSPTICAGNSSTLTASGATNYTWSPGGNTGTSIIITPSATISYSVSGNNGVCGSNATVMVTVNPTPTVTASANNTLVCSGAGSTLTASGATTYTWNPGNITTATTAVTPTASTIYTVTGLSGGCTNTNTVSVTVNNGPTVTIVSSPTTICSAGGASATLTASGAISYAWNPGGIISSTLLITPTVTSTYSVIASDAMGCISTTTVSYSVTPSPTISTIASATAICAGKSATITASGAGSYTWNPGASTGNTIIVSPATTSVFTVTGTNGNCTGTTTIQIVVNPNPTITASASPTVICSGNPATLSANGANTYTWMPGTLTGQTVNVTPGSTTNYSVTGMSVAGCTASAITSVSVNSSPTVNISPSSSTICIGNTTTFTASGATGYTWNPGGSNSASIAVSPTITATYTVTGITGNCTSTKTIAITVNNLPVINAVSNPTSICAGNSATLSANGANTYTWNPGAATGATTAVSPTITSTYTVAGTSTAGCVNTKTVSITVNSNPTVTASGSPTFICSGSGNSATLSATGALNYTWNPGTGTGTSIVVNPTISTTYTVSGANASGCINTKTVSITIVPSPTISITSSPSVICRGNSATITASGASTYTWAPGGNATASIVVSPTSTAVYTVSGTSGSCSSNKTYTLTVLPRPNINILPFPPALCNGGTSLLLATGGVTFTWSPGPINGNTIVVNPTITTTYTVAGTNLAGCSNTAVTTLTVNPTPTLSAALSATQVCSGSSITITSSGALTYVVLPGAQAGSIIAVTPTTNTTYTVTGVNQFGCTDTKTLAVNVLATPTVIANSSGTLLCDGGNFTLTASGANNYTWSPLGSNSSSVITTATNTINTYTLSGESNSCISTVTIGVQVINCNNTIFGVTKAAGTPVLLYDNLYNVSFTVTAINASSLTLNNIVLNEDLALAFPAPASFTVISQPSVISQNSSLTLNPLFDGASQVSLTSPLTSSLAAGKRDTIVFTVRVKPSEFYGPFKNSVIGFADFLNAFTVADSSNDGFAWDPDLDGDPTNNDIPTLITLPYSELFIPNGFSPDGDGRNDLFVIKGLNGRKAKLSIFNRWGNKVYEKSEYDNSWDALPNAGGVILGSNKVPASTYYYILEFLDGDKETKTGFIVVQY